LILFLYGLWYWISEFHAIWSRFYEMDYQCEHPVLPANQSGVKVMVAGFAKSGTRTMSRVLYQLGMEHSYHSEEFGMHVYSSLADNYFLKRSSGAWSGLPSPGLVETEDEEVLNGTSPEELAAAISRCRVDAIAFDGIEKLFWPVYEVSPDAKVILLNWRTFEEWRTSLEAFAPILFAEIFSMGLLFSGFSVLPWGALFHVIDPLVGRRIEKLLRTGGPPICQVYDAYTSLWHSLVSFRRIVTRWHGGISLFPEEEEEYNEYLQKVKQLVPPERLIEWDMKKNTFEDLCQFLGMDPCPRSGRLPRVNNAFIFVQDFPWAFLLKLPPTFLVHWLNWKILSALFSALFSVWRRLVRGKTKVQ